MFSNYHIGRSLCRSGLHSYTHFPLDSIATTHNLASRHQAPCLLRGLPAQRVLVAADGGQIAWTPDTAALNYQCRFVVVRGKARQISALFMGPSTAVDSPRNVKELKQPWIKWLARGLLFVLEP
jgi:hypothetical protein